MNGHELKAARMRVLQALEHGTDTDDPAVQYLRTLYDFAIADGSVPDPRYEHRAHVLRLKSPHVPPGPPRLLAAAVSGFGTDLVVVEAASE